MNAKVWTRPELRERGRMAFQRNYWWCVLAALILMLITGGGSSGRSVAQIGREGLPGSIGITDRKSVV